MSFITCRIFKYEKSSFFNRRIKRNKLDENKFLVDTEIMKKMECDNSVKLIESVETEESFYIISELCFSNLAEYLNKRKNAFSKEEIKDNK